MRSFAPDPETTGDVTTMRLLGAVRWHGPQHRASWRRDPLGVLSLVVLAVGAVMLFCAIVALAVIGAYVVLL